MDSDSDGANGDSDSNDDAPEKLSAVEYMLLNEAYSLSTYTAHVSLRHLGFSEEKINYAFKQLRQPLQKEFNCKKANCATFSSEVNLQRHRHTHKDPHSRSKDSRVLLTQQLTEHWQGLSHEEKSAMILSVDSKHEEIFEITVLETLTQVRRSGETKYLPHEVMRNVDQLAVIEIACGSEVAEFLDSTSEGTFLTNIEYKQPEHTTSESTLERHLIDVLAYYSFFLEMLLVQSLINSKQALAKELDELAALEEAKNNKVDPKLVGESTEQGNKATEETLPKIGGDTPHDVAAATAHGVGSAEHGTGVTPSKPGGVTSHDVAASTSVGVGSTDTAKVADNYSWVYHDFLDLLTGVSFSPNPPQIPYFLGQLEALVFCRDFKFRVFYSDIKRHKKKLAVTIRDHRTKVDEFLKSALWKFVTDNNYHEKLPTIQLFIQDCPAAFTPQTFLDYVKRKPLLEIYKLPHSAKVVIVLTRFGRKIARRLLKYILKMHKSGQCWQGLFSALHIEVTSRDSLFRIVKIGRVAAYNDGIFADLKKYFDILLTEFTDDQGRYPLFFDEFLSDLLKCPGHDSVTFDAFRRTIVVHFAIMPPQSWTDLITKLRDLIPFNHQALKDFIGWLPHDRKWMTPFKEIYEYKCEQGTTSYSPMYAYLLKFARNFPSHGLKHIRNLPGYQTADIELVAVMLADHLGRNLIDLMNRLIARVIMDADGVLREVYLSAWIAFESSDDTGDDDENRVDYENLLYDSDELSDEGES